MPTPQGCPGGFGRREVMADVVRGVLVAYDSAGDASYYVVGPVGRRPPVAARRLRLPGSTDIELWQRLCGE